MGTRSGDLDPAVLDFICKKENIDVTEMVNILKMCIRDRAKEKGYVSTLFHRRRPVPELKSSNFMQRSFGERVAMNSPIPVSYTHLDVYKRQT